jgi:hypothetical protein
MSRFACRTAGERKIVQRVRAYNRSGQILQLPYSESSTKLKARMKFCEHPTESLYTYIAALATGACETKSHRLGLPKVTEHHDLRRPPAVRCHLLLTYPSTMHDALISFACCV